MTYVQGFVLGTVQGLTEFLPVSSSAHLLLVPYAFGWPDQGLAVDAMLHGGTLLALVTYFRTELAQMVIGQLSRRLTALVIVATIPAAGAGALFGDTIERYFRTPALVVASTVFWALVMAFADARARNARESQNDPLELIGWRHAIPVGLAQALALIPGTSRSGITITFGLFSGLDRATAARFSFLLGIPVTAGAAALKSAVLVRAGLPQGETGALLTAFFAAFTSGLVAVWFLVAYLQRRSLRPFVIYRLALALVIIALLMA